MQQIILASNNPGKIKEFSNIFAKINIEIIPQSKLNIPEIDEPFHTFVENSLHKARHASRLGNLPALADDSGLCVNGLNGQPGVYSARYAGEPRNDVKNNQKLIEELALINDKSAYYYCILVLVKSASDQTPIIAEGRLNGIITPRAAGTNGFGYDPHFYLSEYAKTTAELDIETKNQISHRAIALKNLLTKLQESAINSENR